MVKKLFSVVVLLSLVLFVAACGSSGNSNGEGSPSAAASSSPDPVKLTIITWENGGSTKTLREINRKFMEKYPNITVVFTTVAADQYPQLQQTRVIANDVDIVTMDSGFILGPENWSVGAAEPLWKQWIDNGIVADLTGQPFVTHWDSKAIANAVSYKGKVYGLPSGSVSFTGLYYNKAIFDQYGLQVPTTWSELTHVFQVLKDNKVTPLGIAGKEIWPLDLAVQGLSSALIQDPKAFAKGLWDGSKRFTDPAVAEVMAKTQILMKNAEDGFTGVDSGTLLGMFASGKVAMMSDGTWSATTIDTTNPDIKYGYFPLPASDDASKNQTLYGKYDMSFLVMERSKNKDAAKKWMAFYSEPENYGLFVKASGFLPVQANQEANVTPFAASLGRYGFGKAWEQLVIPRSNLGEHISGLSLHTEFLKPFGSMKPEELMALQQKEWDAAATNK